jgi:hypothetical protein
MLVFYVEYVPSPGDHASNSRNRVSKKWWGPPTSKYDKQTTWVNVASLLMWTFVYNMKIN